MLADQHDPIAAIATAPGRGAVGIVRVSAKSVAPLIDALCGRKLKPREATYLPFLDADGSTIDQGLAIYFAAPHSYTGEDVLELQAHGGPVVLQLLLARCLQAGAYQSTATGQATLPGIRLAKPGEFSLRAVLNGKVDLAQAEAISDLIDASTEAAARSASRSLAGEFSKEIHTLRDAFVNLRMLVEATLDFPEEDIDFLEQADAKGKLAALQNQLTAVMQRTRQGVLLREGIKVVIAGQPNVGKSSLLNALAGAELAIVTPVAGTTRDKIQQTIQIEGVPIHVVDTAGLRNSHDEVEQLGIARAWEAIKTADVVLFLHDLTRENAIEYIAEEQAIAGAIALFDTQNAPVLHVWNKADALTLPANPDASNRLILSAKTGQGLDDLRHQLLALAGWQPSGQGVFTARARHTQALARVQAHLQFAAQHLRARNPPLDLLAEELRLAQNALNEMTGEFSSDDLLGVIFSKFCIGK